jgi:hypothetical protein
MSEDKKTHWLALVQGRVALACLELAVSILGGDETLSRLARDLDDWVESETRCQEQRR